jgi:Tol biopolymer transport system component
MYATIDAAEGGMKALVRYLLFFYGLGLLSLAGWHLAMPKNTAMASWIIYVAQTFDHGNQIYQMKLDGSSPVKLSGEVMEVIAPRAVTGRGVIFLSFDPDNSGVFHTNFIDHKPTKISQSGDFVYPEVSPRGDWMVYSRHGDNTQFDIYWLHLRTLATRQLTGSEGGEYVTEISADGEWLLFKDDEGHFYRMRPDGSDLENLSERFGVVADAIFSPDNQWLIYQANVDGRSALYRARLDGSQIEKIVEIMPYLDSHLVITPDGKWLFIAQDQTIYRIPFAGSAKQSLIPPGTVTGFYYNHLKTDGIWLIFSASQDGIGYDIYRMRVDGSGLERLTSALYDEQAVDLVVIPKLVAHEKTLLLGGATLLLTSFVLGMWRRTA